MKAVTGRFIQIGNPLSNSEHAEIDVVQWGIKSSPFAEKLVHFSSSAAASHFSVTLSQCQEDCRAVADLHIEIPLAEHTNLL